MGRYNETDLQLQYLQQQQGIALAQSEPPSDVAIAQVTEYPWVTPPPRFQAIDFQAIIDTPLVGSGDTDVLTFTVPRGFDGIIRRLSHNYTGGGFQQGSGGLVWRILANGRAIKNYDNILFEFGTLAVPRPTDGIRIYENQFIEYVVNVAGGGGFVPSAATSIICTLAGWIWPKQGQEV